MIEPGYLETIEKWRARSEVSLRADDGWLVLAGRFWLHEGSNPCGTDPSNDILLPPGTAAAYVGSFEFHDGKTTLHVSEGNYVTVNGERVIATSLQSDAEEKPSVVALNDITMAVIKRAERYFIRVRDKNSPTRKAFAGRKWYPVDEAYRVEARFIPFEPARKVMNTNILGFEDERVSPGYVEFELGGQGGQLQAFEAHGGRLWFVFRDATSGDTTYGASRFLHTDAPQDGKVILDFNKAYNPPCAFTPYAACPLPPPELVVATH